MLFTDGKAQGNAKDPRRSVLKLVKLSYNMKR